jgi:hypothetical protein
MLLRFALLAVAALQGRRVSAVLPFTKSAYFRKPASSDVQVSGDVTLPEVLAAVMVRCCKQLARRRSPSCPLLQAKKVYKGELIVFAFNTWMPVW